MHGYMLKVQQAALRCRHKHNTRMRKRPLTQPRRLPQRPPPPPPRRRRRPRACGAAAWCAAAAGATPPAHPAAPAARTPPWHHRRGSHCAHTQTNTQARQQHAQRMHACMHACMHAHATQERRSVPDGGCDARFREGVSEREHARTRRRRERRALVRVERDQIHLAWQRRGDGHQAFDVALRVVDVAQQNVLEKHAVLHPPRAATREGGAQRCQQLRQRVLAVHRLCRRRCVGAWVVRG